MFRRGHTVCKTVFFWGFAVFRVLPVSLTCEGNNDNLQAQSGTGQTDMLHITGLIVPETVERER